jgi:hypothetical protein
VQFAPHFRQRIAFIGQKLGEQLLELGMLTGFYHMVSFMVNALRLEPEAYAARFPVA